MARSASPPVSRKSRRLTVTVVLVPETWCPRRVNDVPPAYHTVDHAGTFPVTLANQLRREFNAAEIIARHHGRPAFLWMLAAPVKRGAR